MVGFPEPFPSILFKTLGLWSSNIPGVSLEVFSMDLPDLLEFFFPQTLDVSDDISGVQPCRYLE